MSELDVQATPNSPVAATPATPPAPAFPGPSASPVAPPQVPAAAPIAAPEDRSNWIPPHRLREVREAEARKFAERESAYNARLEQYQNQIRALAGVAPPANTQYDEIKQQFGQVFGPKAVSLFDKAEQIEQALDRIQELEQAVNHVWTSHAQSSMGKIFSQAEEALGGPLSEEGKRMLHTAFTGWVQSNPDYEDRYLNDPTFVGEFWKALSSTLVDPARRIAAAGVAGRTPQALPQDTPAGVPGPAPAPRPANADERMNQAWASYNAYKKV